MFAVAVGCKGVKIGRFGCPECGRVYISERKLFPVGRDESENGSRAVAVKLVVNAETSVGIGVDKYIAQVRSRTAEQIYVAENTVVAQAVLIFKICRIAVSIYFHSDVIFAFGDKFGYIEFRLQARTF